MPTLFRFWFHIPGSARMASCAILSLSMFGYWFWAQRVDGWAWLPPVILFICGVLLTVIRLSWRMVLIAFAFGLWCGILFIFSWVMTGWSTAITFQRLQTFFSMSAYVIVAGIWIIGACRLAEWLDLAGRLPHFGLRLQDMLATHAGAFASRTLTIRQQIDAFSITQLWAGRDGPKNRHETRLRQTVRWFGDRCEFFFVLVAELAGGIAMQLRGDKSEQTVNPKAHPLRLSELYDVPRFSALYKAVFDEQRIAPQWLEALSKTLTPGSSVLDLGSGTGRVSVLLLSRGFNVYAVESNVEFARCCEERLANTPTSNEWAVLRGAFPETCPPQPVAAIILHQNVMLELINKLTSFELWTALRAITVPDGRLLFDYPEKYEVPADGSLRSIIRDLEVDSVRFNYSYRYVEQLGDVHVVRLHFSITDGDLEIVREPYLQIKLPSLDGLLAEAAQFGFEIERKINLSQRSFFPGEMRLLQLRFFA